MDQVPDLQVRVSTPQRDRIVGLLREATADQRLSFEELTERLPRAMRQ